MDRQEACGACGPNEAARIGRALLRSVLASEQLSRAVAAALSLTSGEVLGVLHLAYSGRLTPSQVGARLDLSSGGATALVQRLEHARCVHREPHPADRRSVLVGLTGDAEGRLTELPSPLAERIDMETETLARAERQAVERFLDRVADLTEARAVMLRRGDERDPRVEPQVVVPPLWA